MGGGQEMGLGGTDTVCPHRVGSGVGGRHSPGPHTRRQGARLKQPGSRLPRPLPIHTGSQGERWASRGDADLASRWQTKQTPPRGTAGCGCRAEDAHRLKDRVPGERLSSHYACPTPSLHHGPREAAAASRAWAAQPATRALSLQSCSKFGSIPAAGSGLREQPRGFSTATGGNTLKGTRKPSWQKGHWLSSVRQVEPLSVSPSRYTTAGGENQPFPAPRLRNQHIIPKAGWLN